ncbi:hypothetical protein FA13DRAFT_1705341 [Coprinellus micaceus]|uniref:Uncharacterized protein n=1 Tax=Coprinellus micaceus TaxID=71717 RepID=A0A4Y7TW75_COPMI|nr:hypothetical protein FA13DRAFT_1705341 [Coprinellus micaceus]
MPVNRSKPQQALQLRAEWTAGGGCDGDQWVFQLTHTDRRASDERHVGAAHLSSLRKDGRAAGIKERFLGCLVVGIDSVNLLQAPVTGPLATIVKRTWTGAKSKKPRNAAVECKTGRDDHHSFGPLKRVSGAECNLVGRWWAECARRYPASPRRQCSRASELPYEIVDSSRAAYRGVGPPRIETRSIRVLPFTDKEYAAQFHQRPSFLSTTRVGERTKERCAKQRMGDVVRWDLRGSDSESVKSTRAIDEKLHCEGLRFPMGRDGRKNGSPGPTTSVQKKEAKSRTMFCRVTTCPDANARQNPGSQDTNSESDEGFARGRTGVVAVLEVGSFSLRGPGMQRVEFQAIDL